jgi:hypothetical protein
MQGNFDGLMPPAPGLCVRQLATLPATQVSDFPQSVVNEIKKPDYLFTQATRRSQ